MPDRPTPRQQRRRQQLTRQLADLGYALPGTITSRMMRCGKANCRCKHDPPRLHGPYVQWTRTVNGKTVTKLLSGEQLARYQDWFDNHHKLRELINELEELSVEAIHQAENW